MGRKIRSLLIFLLIVVLCTTAAFAEPVRIPITDCSTHFIPINKSNHTSLAVTTGHFQTGSSFGPNLYYSSYGFSPSMISNFDSFLGIVLPSAFTPEYTYIFNGFVGVAGDYQSSSTFIYQPEMYLLGHPLPSTYNYYELVKVGGVDTSVIDYGVASFTSSTYDNTSHTSTLIGYDFSVTFRMTSQTSISLDSFNFLFTSSNCSVSGSDLRTFGLYDIGIYYDPTGEILQSETDKIIQGQKDAIIYGQEQEQEAAIGEGSSAEADAQDEASNAFNFTSFSDALSGLVSALGYTGSDFHFYLPAAQNIPYIGSLWNRQEVPIKQYIDMLPTGLLYIIRFLAWLGLLFSVVRMIRKLIQDINGGGDD